MKRAQALAPGSCSVERLGWEEELMKEPEKGLPERRREIERAQCLRSRERNVSMKELCHVLPSCPEIK